MKKTLYIVGGFAFFVLVPHVFAQGFVPLAPIPGLTDAAGTGSVINSASLATFFNNLYKYLIGVAAILAVIEIVWGGILIAGESVTGKSAGKERITNAILGLVLVLSPFLVFTIINPSILNLSLDLPYIKQTGAAGTSVNGAAGGAGNTGTTATTTTTTTAAGNCTALGGNYFKALTCTTQAAATSYSCPSGTTLQTNPCTTVDQNGNPLCTTFTGYCEATMSPNPYAYQYYTFASGASGAAQWIPRDAAAATAFENACRGDGGKPIETGLTGSWVAVLGKVVNNGCPADAGTIPINTTQVQTAVCYPNTVVCGPP